MSYDTYLLPCACSWERKQSTAAHLFPLDEYQSCTLTSMSISSNGKLGTTSPLALSILQVLVLSKRKRSTADITRTLWSASFDFHFSRAICFDEANVATRQPVAPNPAINRDATLGAKKGSANATMIFAAALRASTPLRHQHLFQSHGQDRKMPAHNI